MSRQTTDRTREKINTIMVPHLKPYYCYCYKSTYVHKGMQVKPKVGSIIYLCLLLPELPLYLPFSYYLRFTSTIHSSIHSYPDCRHTKKRHKMNLLIATTAAFALLISTVSAGAVRVFFISLSNNYTIPTSLLSLLTFFFYRAAPNLSDQDTVTMTKQGIC